jgi:putative NADH-flavin reductase
MQLVIFGATGGTGTCLVEQALAAGHVVTAIVRDPSRLAVPAHERLRTVTADVTDPAAIIPAVADAGAVLSALGPRGTGATSLHQDSARSIIAAMQKSGVRRLIAVSGSVVADEGDGPVLRYLLKPLVRGTLLRHVCADMRAAEDVIQSSDLDWTIVRPPRLTSKPGKGTYRTAVDRNVPRCLTISRADLAAGMLALLDDAAAVHRHVCIAD